MKVADDVYTLFQKGSATVAKMTDDDDFYHLEDTQAQVWKLICAGKEEKALLNAVVKHEKSSKDEASQYLAELLEGLVDLKFLIK